MTYFQIPLWLEAIQLFLIAIEIFGWLYLMFLKDWLTHNVFKNGKVKHGTYIEIGFYDMGVKSGNFPPIRVDDITTGVQTWINNTLSPSAATDVNNVLAKHFTVGQIQKIMKEIEKLGKK